METISRVVGLRLYRAVHDGCGRIFPVLHSSKNPWSGDKIGILGVEFTFRACKFLQPRLQFILRENRKIVSTPAVLPESPP